MLVVQVSVPATGVDDRPRPIVGLSRPSKDRLMRNGSLCGWSFRDLCGRGGHGPGRRLGQARGPSSARAHLPDLAFRRWAWLKADSIPTIGLMGTSSRCVMDAPSGPRSIGMTPRGCGVGSSSGAEEARGRGSALLRWPGSDEVAIERVRSR